MGYDRASKGAEIRVSLLSMQDDALEYMYENEYDAYSKAWGFSYELGKYTAIKNIYGALHSITLFWTDFYISDLVRDYSEAFLKQSSDCYNSSKDSSSVGDTHREAYYKALAETYEIQHKVLKDILERADYNGA